MMLAYPLSRSVIVLLLLAIVNLASINESLNFVDATDPGCREPTEEDFQAVCEAYIALINAVEPFSGDCDEDGLVDDADPQTMTRSAQAASLKAMFPDCLFEEGVFEDNVPAPTTTSVPVMISEPPTTVESPTTMAPVPVTTKSPVMEETEPPSSLEDNTSEPSGVNSAPIVVTSAPAVEDTSAPALVEVTAAPAEVTSAPATDDSAAPDPTTEPIEVTSAPILDTTTAPAGPNDDTLAPIEVPIEELPPIPDDISTPPIEPLPPASAAPNVETLAPVGGSNAFIEVPIEEGTFSPIPEDVSTPPVIPPSPVSAAPNDESTPTEGPNSSTSLDIIQWPLGEVCQPPACNGTLTLVESTEETAITAKSAENQDGFWYGLVGNGSLLSVMAICDDDTNFPSNISFAIYMGSECDTLTCLATGMVSVQAEDCMALEEMENEGPDINVRRRRRRIQQRGRRLDPSSINDGPPHLSEPKFRLADFYSQPGMPYTVFLPKGGGATAGQNGNVFVPQVPPVLVLEVEETLNHNNASTTTTTTTVDDNSSTVSTTEPKDEDVMVVPLQPPTPPPNGVPSSGSFKADSKHTPTLQLLLLSLSTTTYLVASF